MEDLPFHKCVFVNAPFDKDYEPVLQAVLFTVVYLGFFPRLATERMDGGEARLDKILQLIRSSQFSIHDLSRCQAVEAGEHYRLNMPFELGLDFACRLYLGEKYAKKCILILEEQKYRYQAALSDLAGSDIEAHGGNYQKATRKVRNWLVSEAGAENAGAKRILGAYTDFSEWYYERQLAAGHSEEDIKDYPTKELLSAMQEWVDLGKPV